MTTLIRKAVEPAMAAIRADLAARDLITPDPATVDIATARAANRRYFAAIAEPRVDVARLELAVSRAVDGAETPLKIAVPHGAKPDGPAVLYFHGGGYAFGDLDTHDHVIRAFAAGCGMPVVGVHYRRTPEHPWPAALGDAMGAIAAMRDGGLSDRFGFDQSRVLLLGDSAGAHLCFSLMLALRAAGLPQPLGAALLYGMYARRSDSLSHRTYGDGSEGLSTARMDWFWSKLFPEHDPAFAPFENMLAIDPAGLAPLALFAAECDCLLSDTLDLADALALRGHPHTFRLFEAMPHGFIQMSSLHDGTRKAVEAVGTRLREFAA
jgi:acetyl esterase